MKNRLFAPWTNLKNEELQRPYMKNFTPTCPVEEVTPENLVFGELSEERFQLLW